MALGTSVRSTDRWTITDNGREALASSPTCNCHVRIVGLLVECGECGTVYGSLRDREDAGKPRTEKRS